MTVYEKYAEMRDHYVKQAAKTSGEAHELCLDAIARIDNTVSIMPVAIANSKYVEQSAIMKDRETREKDFA